MFLIDWVINLFKLGRGFVSLLFCVGISFFLMALDTDGKALFYQVSTATLLLPVNSVLNIKQKYFFIYKENQILRNENFNLKTNNDLLTQYKLQNVRMREMIDFKDQSGYTLLPGEIVARNPGRLETSWIINLGTRDSVKVNMPVLTSKGVVGKIAKVYGGTSLVQLMHDPTCKISVIVQRSRVIGIMESYQVGSLIARFPAHSDVVYGDTLVTSGMGGVFPKGLSVGVVNEENRHTTDIIKGVGVNEFQNTDVVEEVFIYKKESDWILVESK